MKARTGFVSNSSSSSFVIGTRGTLTKEKVKKAINVPYDSMLKDFADAFADALLDAEEVSPELSSYHGRFRDAVEKMIDRGMSVYEGSASSEDSEAAEFVLCEMKIDYDDGDLIVFKEASF